MPSNSTGTIAIFRNASNVAKVNLSAQDSGVRVRAIPAGGTQVFLPDKPFPNDGDGYQIIDADGSSSLLNPMTIIPPAGTTIRGGASFVVSTPFINATVSFDAASDDWIVDASSASGAPSIKVLHQQSVTVPAFGSLIVGPFTPDANKAMDVWVTHLDALDVGFIATWGETAAGGIQFVWNWYNNTDPAGSRSVRFANGNAADAHITYAIVQVN